VVVPPAGWCNTPVQDFITRFWCKPQARSTFATSPWMERREQSCWDSGGCRRHFLFELFGYCEPCERSKPNRCSFWRPGRWDRGPRRSKASGSRRSDGNDPGQCGARFRWYGNFRGRRNLADREYQRKHGLFHRPTLNPISVNGIYVEGATATVDSNAITGGGSLYSGYTWSTPLQRSCRTQSP